MYLLTAKTMVIGEYKFILDVFFCFILNFINSSFVSLRISFRLRPIKHFKKLRACDSLPEKYHMPLIFRDRRLSFFPLRVLDMKNSFKLIVYE